MKKFILIILTLLLLVLGFTYFFFFFKETTNLVTVIENKNQAILNSCLGENEVVEYKIVDKKDAPSSANIIIKEKNSNEQIFKFQIDNIIPNHYHGYEIHQCGVYVIREFNFDFKKYKPLPDFSVELWRYQYNGNGEKLLILAGENRNAEAKVYYSYDFRIDTFEKYFVLEKSYLGKDDYALVIKDLNTKEDIFVLSAKSTFEQYSNVVGNFGLDKWTDDGRYFWGDIFDGAYVNAYFRIDTKNWTYNIFEAPDGAMGGSHLNINTGYLPIQPGQVWTGDAELTQELKKKERKEGKKSSLYLYNLFTKEKILIETTEEPQFWFKPQWLSDAELQYELSTGEKKIYKIKKY